MKKTMKKITAGLVALLMAVQLAPALGATYSSGTIVGSPEGYKEELEIVASKGTAVLMGQTLQLDVNEDYTVTWTSGNPAVATIDEDGLVTAVADGTATVTAQAGQQMDSVDITVIDPEPILQEVNAEMKQEQPAEGSAEEPAEEPAGEPEAQAPAAKRAMVIVINGENENTVYNGEEHVLDRYVATSNDDEFDPEKVKVSGDLGVKATNCGTYILDLEKAEFTYDDPNVAARFVVNNSFLKITPAKVTVTANAAEKEEGENDPELTATVEGLIGEDTIDYTLERFPGETAGQYVIEASGEKTQKNYRIDYADGIFTIKESFGKEYPLYNMVSINGTWYRLAKTTVRTKVDMTKNFGKKQNPDDYKAEPYDFTDLVITVNGKEYVYNCEKNREAIEAGVRYYTASFTNYECIKNKIGGMNGSTPRWAIPEEQRYDDPNATDSFHRNYTVKLYDNPIEQDLYNFLKVDNSNNYYRLRKTRIIAGRLEEYGNNATLSSSQYQIPDGEYNFSGVTLTVGGTTYRYSDHELEGDYESYYTVRFDRVIKQNRINGNADWYANDEGWLDGAKGQYGAEGNDVTGWHRDYVATLHEGTIQPAEGDVTLYAQGKLDGNKSVTITSSWPKDKPAFAGTMITLTAHPEGFENVEYTLQWQRSKDQINWIDVPGENGNTFTYELTEDNAKYFWRVAAIENK